MRTTTLTTAALLGLAMLGPIPVANAAGETCRGEAATIVGTPANPALLGSDGVTGTEGRDVVVTNGAFKVSTLGGDDVICVTAGGASSVKRVMIDSGAGDDVVDGTTAPDWIVQAELGEGADRFEGGDAGNFVRGAYSNAPQRTPRGTSSSAEMVSMGSTAASSGTPTPTSSLWAPATTHSPMGVSLPPAGRSTAAPAWMSSSRRRYAHLATP